MASWSLENAADIAARYPYTFYTPSSNSIAALTVGERVKLIFRAESAEGSPAGQTPQTEGMWVSIARLDGQGGFVGMLLNQSDSIQGLVAGTAIEFRDIHIANIENDSQDKRLEKYASYCIVSNRVLKEGAKVGFLYREEADRADDSGWCITAGDESQAYMDEVTNVSYVTLGAVLNCDDSIISLLDAKAGAEFVRAGNTPLFVKA